MSGSVSKTVCEKCGREISLSNIKKHVAACNGRIPAGVLRAARDSLNCIYCGKLCKNNNSLAQHERCCRENPDRQITPLMKYNLSDHSGCNQYTKAKKLGLPKPEISEATRRKMSEKARGRLHTEAFKSYMSKLAKEREFGGWHTSRSFRYRDVILDSSYEKILAEDLDKNNVKWERPRPFLYTLNGEQHRYYPDFLLPEFNVYIDTKNDFLINNINPKLGISDVEKIKLVSEQNHVRILILDKNNLTWDKAKTFL